jgi:hypothetical protein
LQVIAARQHRGQRFDDDDARPERLPQPVATLQERNQDGNRRNEVISIDIGGNDVFPLVNICAGGVTPECAQAIPSRFATVAQN